MVCNDNKVKMKIKCLFGLIHKWEYDIEIIHHIVLAGIDCYDVECQNRYCLNCRKKQIKPFQLDNKWINWKMNKVELRDNKIKDLGL